MDSEKPICNALPQRRPFLQTLELGFQVNYSKCTLAAVFFYKTFKTGSQEAKTDSSLHVMSMLFHPAGYLLSPK